MADEKYTVYLRGSNGKAYKAASFEGPNAADEAAAFRHKHRRAGEDTFLAAGDASADQLKRAFPSQKQSRPVNDARAAAISSAKTQILDEQIAAEARAELEGDSAKATEAPAKEPSK